MKTHCVAFMLLTTLSSVAFPQDATPADDYDRISIGAMALSLDDAKIAFKANDIRMPTNDGVLLYNVLAYSPAGLAGLTGMDVVTRVDRTSIASVEEYESAIAALTAGKSCEIAGFRGKMSPSGRVSWKRGSVKLAPMTRREMLLNAMAIEKDDIKGIEVYRHKDSPASPNSQSDLHCYLVKSQAGVLLNLRVQYVAKDWLFFNRVIIKADDNVFSLGEDEMGGSNRDLGRGKIWEWRDAAVSPETRKMLEAISNAKETTIRLEGEQYQKDLEMPPHHKQRIFTVLAVHDMLAR